jgi:hypothetical protein
MTLFARRSIVAALTLLLLIAVNSTARPGKSDSETKYESWLQQTESLLDSTDNSPAGVPLVIIRATANKDGRPIKWELTSSNETLTRNDQLVRLLDLMREANVFGKKDFVPIDQPGHFVISVEDAKSSFKATLGPKDLEESLPARNLLKLFEVYATTDPNKAFAKNSATVANDQHQALSTETKGDQASPEPANK